MEVIRILNLRHFDRNVRRFRDIVCKNASKSDPSVVTPDGRGGFSVFDPACACVNQAQNPNCVCNHISRFYDRVAGEPCAYWIFDHDIFNPPPPGLLPLDTIIQQYHASCRLSTASWASFPSFSARYESAVCGLRCCKNSLMAPSR